jgi:CHC2 zinc finger
MDPLLEYLARSDTEASGEPIPQHIVDAIRDALPPSVVIGRYVQLKKAGRELRGLSPFAKERTPSFFVNDDKRRWFDFSSNQNGDVFQFVMAFENVTFPEAVRRCGEMCGILIMPDRKTAAPMSAEDMARLAAEREECCRVEAAERRESERKATNMAKAIFTQSIAFAMGDGSPPARFFESRGLVMPADASPRALRYSPRCPFRGDDGELVYHHALIGLFRDVNDDKVRASRGGRCRRMAAASRRPCRWVQPATARSS